MRQMPVRLLTWTVAVTALLLFVGAGLVGGPDNMREVATIHSLAVEREARVGLTGRAIMITHLGGAPVLTLFLVVAIAWLAYVRRWHRAFSLAAIVLGGRVAVELLKLAIDRPRPFFSPYPVEIVSLSFPSGHAANTMITFLALALFMARPRFRVIAIIVAAAASVLVGVTRPLLGVHWPSDVVGGWAFGTAWVVIGFELSRRWIDPAK